MSSIRIKVATRGHYSGQAWRRGYVWAFVDENSITYTKGGGWRCRCYSDACPHAATLAGVLDPDLLTAITNWKAPDMTTPNLTAEAAGDFRRATILIAALARKDLDGVQAILTEAVEAERLVHLPVCVAQLTLTLLPELRSDDAAAVITSAVLKLAQQEQEQQ